MDKVLRFKARRASPKGIPSMIVDGKGGYVRYADYKRMVDELDAAYAEIDKLDEDRSMAINPVCD